MRPLKIVAKVKNRELFVGLVFSILIAIPNIVWIFLNNEPFGGDGSFHAIDSVRLYYSLVHSTRTWFQELLQVVPFKGPGLGWMGQIFVNLGLVFGSIDKALLVSIALVQFLTLLLLYQSVLLYSEGSVYVGICSIMLLGSAPLFIKQSHEFLFEPLQTLVVTGFLYILCSVQKWRPAYTTSQLLIVSLLALLVRASTVVYVVILGLGILCYVITSGGKPWTWDWRARSIRRYLIISVLLISALAYWYIQNLPQVLAHSRRAAFGETAALWGVDESFINTLGYWVSEIIRVFFLPPSLFLFAGILLVGGLVWAYSLRGKRKKNTHFTVITAIVILQIIFVLLLFSISPNRLTRFLLPLSPLITMLLAWSLVKIRVPTLNMVLPVVLGLQIMLSQAYALRLLPSGDVELNIFSRSDIWPYDNSRTYQAILDGIVARTCDTKAPTILLSIIAIDPALFGHWIGPSQVEYSATKDFGLGIPCTFAHIGDHYFGSSLEVTWEYLLAQRARYVVTTDPWQYPPPTNAVNQVLTPKNHPEFVEMLRNSDHFVEEKPLNADPGILIFRRLDYIFEGRILLDQGNIKDAIPLLEKAVKLESQEYKAWANLTLGYVLADRQDEALAAGARALALNPDHFYVHLMIAEILQERADHHTALEHLREAILSAPSDQEEIRALRSQAKSLLALGKVRQACFAFAEALEIDPLPEITAEMSELDCERLIGGE